MAKRTTRSAARTTSTRRAADETPVEETEVQQEETTEETQTLYRVKHLGVGNFKQGQVISADSLPEGADVGRLLDLGAIETISEEDAAGEEVQPRLADPLPSDEEVERSQTENVSDVGNVPDDESSDEESEDSSDDE